MFKQNRNTNNRLDSEVWENRTTTRLFSEEHKIIPPEDVKYLAKVINNIPSQCSIKSHFWVYLGQSKEDLKIRKWLADNIYWSPWNEKNLSLIHISEPTRPY